MKGFIRKTIKSKKAEGYVDSGVKILIAVVIGALLLGGVYTFQRYHFADRTNQSGIAF